MAIRSQQRLILLRMAVVLMLQPTVTPALPDYRWLDKRTGLVRHMMLRFYESAQLIPLQLCNMCQILLLPLSLKLIGLCLNLFRTLNLLQWRYLCAGLGPTRLPHCLDCARRGCGGLHSPCQHYPQPGLTPLPPGFC